MATYDDILGGGQPLGQRSPMIKSPIPPISADLKGSPGGYVAPDPNASPTEKPTEIVATTNQPEDTTSTTTQPRKRMSYLEMYQQLNPYKPPTPAEIEHEKKKQKRQSIFAAIGDGISAMANLYYTSQYSPNAWDANNSMSKKTRERWDALQKEREANARTYMEGYLRAMALDDAADSEERSWRHQLDREKLDDEYKERAMIISEAKAARDEKMADLKEQRLLGQISEQEYRAQIKETEAQYADAYQRSRIAKNNRTGTGRGGGGGKGGGGATKRYPVFNKDGDVIDHVYTKDEAISETERNGGTYPGSTSTNTKPRGKRTTTTTRTTKPTAGRQARETKPAKKKNRLGL